MSYLVNFVARLVNDTEFQWHTLADTQDALNVYRGEARYEELTPIETRASGGTVTYLNFHGRPYWAETVTFTNNAFTTITPATTDYRNGRFTFSAEPTRPVRITGYYYDPYSSAADLLEVRIAQLSEKAVNRTNSTGAGNQGTSDNQIIDNLKALIDRYRSMATSTKGSGLVISQMYRGDMW